MDISERLTTPNNKEEWLKRSLKALEYPDPTSIVPCLQCPSDTAPSDDDDERIADTCLWKLVLWLETHKICQWDALKRHREFQPNNTNTKRNLASSSRVEVLEKYMTDCGCPPHYVEQLWYCDERKRFRVIRWIISRAIVLSFKNSQPKHAYTPPRSSCEETLGFHTDDDTVIPHALLLRKTYLRKLRLVQDDANRKLGEMQMLAIASANEKQKNAFTK
mmetsp:Transcript_16086/g.22978  ORF Transcript_16086/g.22978 Transcript_16086/m.22978 type:complete len:219 (-) Transcript_16086:113-769(-)